MSEPNCLASRVEAKTLLLADILQSPRQVLNTENKQERGHGI